MIILIIKKLNFEIKSVQYAFRYLCELIEPFHQLTLLELLRIYVLICLHIKFSIFLIMF